MMTNSNRSFGRPATFETIPLTEVIRQINGPEQREPVYFFGQVTKVQNIELPGEVYPWARDIPVPTDND